MVLVSGHPLAIGRAQDRKRSPVKDNRSTTVLPSVLSKSCSSFLQDPCFCAIDHSRPSGADLQSVTLWFCGSARRSVRLTSGSLIAQMFQSRGGYSVDFRVLFRFLLEHVSLYLQRLPTSRMGLSIFRPLCRGFVFRECD